MCFSPGFHSRLELHRSQKGEEVSKSSAELRIRGVSPRLIWISPHQPYRPKMFPKNNITNKNQIKWSFPWLQNNYVFYKHVNVELTCFSAVVLAIFSSMRVKTSEDISSRSASLIFSKSLIKGMCPASSKWIWFRSAWMALPWPPRSGSKSWSLLETFSLAEILLSFLIVDEISCRVLDYLRANVQQKSFFFLNKRGL